jgi:hypothetical protein
MAPYKIYCLKPTKLELAKLKLAYQILMNYLHGTKVSLSLLEFVWYRELCLIQSLLKKVGMQEYVKEMAEVQKVRFTIRPELGFAYYSKQDVIEINLWQWFFGPNDPKFQYNGLRHRPIFEKAAILVHELKHRQQAKKSKTIGKTSEFTHRKRDEIEAFSEEYTMLNAYAEIKTGVYKVACCQVLKWKRTGDCVASFETTWEQSPPILGELQNSIVEIIKQIKSTNKKKFKKAYYRSDENLKIIKELQVKLKLPIKKTPVKERFIEIPFLAKKE